MIKISVDNQEIEVKEGANLLKTCLSNDIYIPNLCYMDMLEHPPASCRLCFVEIEGRQGPVPACQMEVIEEMVVKTDTPAVRRLQRTALELLLSVHHVDCGHCPANKKCELQKIARFLKVGLKPKRLERFLKDQKTLDDHPFLNHHPNRCVLCGKCIQVCREAHGTPAMDFADRGFKTLIRFYGQQTENPVPCEECESCVQICPVGALTLKTATDAIQT
ncbi:MAG TPA: 2Fe-2S iron-sulfur cluster-binding protein [Desulfobacteria bacterium]|nr:2Fe-2S iron-sulfur cluster-binding protein [Desulfobacteria bacterium]